MAVDVNNDILLINDISSYINDLPFSKVITEDKI
jgi:hypothetical protein